MSAIPRKRGRGLFEREEPVVAAPTPTPLTDEKREAKKEKVSRSSPPVEPVVEPQPSERAARPRGRPRMVSSSGEKIVATNLRLNDGDLSWLDDQVRALKAHGAPRSTSAAQVARGIFRALRDSGIDLTSAATAEDIEQGVRAAVLGKMKR